MFNELLEGFVDYKTGKVCYKCPHKEIIQNIIEITFRSKTDILLSTYSLFYLFIYLLFFTLKVKFKMVFTFQLFYIVLYVLQILSKHTFPIRCLKQFCTIHNLRKKKSFQHVHNTIFFQKTSIHLGTLATLDNRSKLSPHKKQSNGPPWRRRRYQLLL